MEGEEDSSLSLSLSLSFWKMRLPNYEFFGSQISISIAVLIEPLSVTREIEGVWCLGSRIFLGCLHFQSEGELFLV